MFTVSEWGNVYSQTPNMNLTFCKGTYFLICYYSINCVRLLFASATVIKCFLAPERKAPDLHEFLKSQWNASVESWTSSGIFVDVTGRHIDMALVWLHVNISWCTNTFFACIFGLRSFTWPITSTLIATSHLQSGSYNLVNSLALLTYFATVCSRWLPASRPCAMRRNLQNHISFHVSFIFQAVFTKAP